jgi:ABC-type phosphate transport system substrate-binding protein
MNSIHKYIFAGLTLVASAVVSAQVVVVVGAKSAASALTTEQAASLFLGKSDQIPGVGVALLLDQAEANPVREQFYTKVAGKSASQVKAAWSRLVFSGKATPPKELANSAEVKKIVANNANAVGYIEKAAVDASVKVLLSAE